MQKKKTTQKKIVKNKTSVLLPSYITPVKYTLTLKPDLESFTFEGNEVIDVVISKPTKSITLHSKDLAVTSAGIIIGKEKVFATNISYDTKSETATFTFKNNIPKGKLKLSLIFSGIISEGLRGFYRSHYTIDGVQKKIATTQFEATDARRAFPCFDEPAQKAIFDVSLIVPGTHTAISNTLPTKISEHEGGYKTISFESTPKMSTYLLAFIIGEFEFIEGYTKDKTRVRVFTTPGKKHQAKFALEVAIKSLEFYNNYFGIPYPLKTLDMIAIPDFESGAMENWGAVTYRETAILVDEKNSSLGNKQWVALVIAHELAHQWFGNLVTMHWWTDLWLNEGFASYIEYLAVDHIFPNWKIWDQFLTSDTAVALRLDALANSHPIEVTVNHPSEINEIFDAVSYSKGAAVIRMLAEYLGQDNFKKGLQHYLKKHSYKNTHTTDLWESFEKISKKPVKKIMANWTGKTGYPLVSFSNKGGCTQERFFSSRISAKNNKEKTIWQIPIDGKLMTKKNESLKVDGKINKGETTLLRVKYNVLPDIKNLSTHDRLGLIRDMFALAEGGYINTVEALEFSLQYKNETEYIVWAEIASGINRIYNIITDEPFKEIYKKYALSFYSQLAEKLGWEKKKGEDHSHIFLRSLALANAGAYGDIHTIKHAQKLFKDVKKNPIPADIRSVVYGIVAANGTEAEWNIFEKLYTNEKMHEEKNRYGSALGHFKDKTLLAKTLTYAMSKNVRTQDAPSVIGTVWSNSAGRDLTWKFIQHNWNTLLKNYGEGGHFLGRILTPLGSHTKVSDAKQVEKFFKTHLAPGAARTIEQSLERIYSNAAWLSADKTAVKNWLTKHYK